MSQVFFKLLFPYRFFFLYGLSRQHFIQKYSPLPKVFVMASWTIWFSLLRCKIKVTVWYPSINTHTPSVPLKSSKFQCKSSVDLELFSGTKGVFYKLGGANSAHALRTVPIYSCEMDMQWLLK